LFRQITSEKLYPIDTVSCPVAPLSVCQASPDHSQIAKLRQRSQGRALFTKKIVFVIGAGASRDYNFPLGSELKDQISRAVRFRFQHGSMLVNGSQELLDHIRRHIKDPNSQSKMQRVDEYTRAANKLANAAPLFVSIDEALHFVSDLKEAVDVGKLAIIESILRAERASTLAFNKANGRPELPDGWIAEVLSMALAGLQRKDLATCFASVTFVNFNYDRAIEQYLYWALQERTGATADEALAIVTSLDMLRPYGSIGQFSPKIDSEFAFGADCYFDPFTRLATLGTYTDRTPMHDQARMAAALQSAELVVFLGFGYHPSNMNVISQPGPKGKAQVIGTALGIHERNHSAIITRIADDLVIPTDSIAIENMKATDLLRDLRPQILMRVG